MAKKKWVHSRNDRLYGIWIGMKSRCYRKTHHEFHRYGALLFVTNGLIRMIVFTIGLYHTDIMTA